MGDWWSEEIVQSAVVNQKLTDGVEHPAPFPEKIVDRITYFGPFSVRRVGLR
jgi:hypothetical protein